MQKSLERIGEVLVGYHKKGYPKQEPKRFLRPCLYQCQRTTTRSRLILRFARGPHRKGLRRKADSSPRQGPLTEALSPEAPRIKPQTKYRFSDSLEASSATTSSPPSRPTSLTKRHVQLMRPTTPATSAARRRSTAEWPTGRETRLDRGYRPLCSALYP